MTDIEVQDKPRSRRKKAEAQGSNAAVSLKSYVDRIENLDTEIDVIRDDMKDIFAEAESNGFTKKAMKMLIAKRKRERKQSRAETEEMELLVAEYERALLDS